MKVGTVILLEKIPEAQAQLQIERAAQKAGQEVRAFCNENYQSFEVSQSCNENARWEVLRLAGPCKKSRHTI